MKDVHLIVMRVLLELFGLTNYIFLVQTFATFTNVLTSWYNAYNNRCSKNQFVFFGTRLLPVMDDLLQIMSFDALDLIMRRLDLESILEPEGILKTLLEVSITFRFCSSYQEVLGVLHSSKHATFVAQIKTCSEALALHLWISRHFILYDFAFDLVQICFSKRKDVQRPWFKFLFSRNIFEWADKLRFSDPRWNDRKALDFLANCHVTQRQLVAAVYFTPDNVGGIAKKKFLSHLRFQQQQDEAGFSNLLPWLHTNGITLYDVSMWLQPAKVQKKHKKQMKAAFFVIFAIIKLRQGKRKKERLKQERKERKKARKEIVLAEEEQVEEQVVEQSTTQKKDKDVKKTKSEKRKEQKESMRLARAALRCEAEKKAKEEEEEEKKKIVDQPQENQIPTPPPATLPKSLKQESKSMGISFELYCNYRFAMLLHERIYGATKYLLQHFNDMSNSTWKHLKDYRQKLQVFFYPFHFFENDKDPIPKLITIAQELKRDDFTISLSKYIHAEPKSLKRYKTCLVLFNAQRDIFKNLQDCLQRVPIKTKGESRDELSIFYEPNFDKYFAKKDIVTLHNCQSQYPRAREMWDALQSEHFHQFVELWCDDVTNACSETSTAQLSLLGFLKIRLEAAKFAKKVMIDNENTKTQTKNQDKNKP